MLAFGAYNFDETFFTSEVYATAAIVASSQPTCTTLTPSLFDMVSVRLPNIKVPNTLEIGHAETTTGSIPSQHAMPKYHSLQHHTRRICC